MLDKIDGLDLDKLPDVTFEAHALIITKLCE